MAVLKVGLWVTEAGESRQDRKVATVIVIMCAEDVLLGSLFFCLKFADSPAISF